MRSFILAAALFCASAAPVLAQAQTEMDRAESDLRATTPQASGATIERRSPDEIVVSMPSDITFAFNSADVRYQFEPVIRNLARTLDRHPGLAIDIVGHADAIGSDDYNQRLSERRAHSVGASLMDFGVDYDRIETSGRGEWEPIASNDSEWGRARNRRVEIHLKPLRK
jgi:outer membrane protein OmpA-like peptidoglycan-associated protein